MSYEVKLHSFEGPLDLLLHLIHKNDVDLYDIPLKEITEQYLTYIHAMQVLELDIASEYLVMAATLLQMKSRLLLPIEEPVEEDPLYMEEEDMVTEEDLVERLAEYKRYKEAAGELKMREMERSRLFTKPMTDLTPLLQETKEEGTQVEANVFDMLKAFKKMKKRKDQKKPRERRITREEIPINEQMIYLRSRLDASGGRSTFQTLLEGRDDALVVSFLAVLELMKKREIRCTQKDNYEDIWIEAEGVTS
ncbi:segregation/condensation protein A [Alkalicoccus urumqiensis]|uniref:Segregation and condensation protein A n=1 Tax=Alkalicoccus urumqiensis TaxID=1548213 RepID=A0A2P6MKF3_ALKUR|nr:segregation/condensation protein A [Alkalicoccus urumqiensis]PRO66772.1 segregation/condensation protein A [Alkalicoccus urumqiensis]